MAESSIVKLFTAEPLPQYPNVQVPAEMQKYIMDLHNYLRRLAQKIGQTITIVNEQGSIRVQDDDESYNKQRIGLQFGSNAVVTDGDDTGEALINFVGGGDVGSVTDILNATSLIKADAEFINIASTNNTYLYMFFVANGDGVDLKLASEPPSVTVVVDVQYDATTHKLQKKTRTITPFSAGSVSSWADWTGGQPVEVARVVRDVNYSTSTHVIDEDIVENVYVLEKGSDTNDVNIDSADSCT